MTLVLGPWLHLGFLSANNAASLDQIHTIIPLPSASHPPSVQMEAWVYTSTLRSVLANQGITTPGFCRPRQRPWSRSWSPRPELGIVGLCHFPSSSSSAILTKRGSALRLFLSNKTCPPCSSSVLRDTVHNPAPLTPENWARARNGVLKTDGSQPSSAPHPSEQQQPTTATPSPGDSSGVDK